MKFLADDKDTPTYGPVFDLAIQCSGRGTPFVLANKQHQAPIAERTRQKTAKAILGEASRDYVLISLFDGINTAYNTLSATFGPPTAAILAEQDDRVRQITASLHNIDPESDQWQRNKHNIPVLYAFDVWDLLVRLAQPISELLKLAKQDAEVVIVAGSPCQDLTIYGPNRGLLGFTGF
jgi:hypothetical protein